MQFLSPIHFFINPSVSPEMGLGDQSPTIRVLVSVSNTLIFELPGVKSCISRLCTNPLGDPPENPPPCPPTPTHTSLKSSKKWV